MIFVVESEKKEAYLDGNVCQMHEHVVKFCDICGILLITKPAKPIIVHPYLQRPVASNQNVKPQIKFLPPNQHRPI